VTVLLDTNVLIRHFTVTARSGGSGERLGSVEPLRRADPARLHVASVSYVLEGVYRQSRGEVVDLLGSRSEWRIEFEHEMVIRRCLDSTEAASTSPMRTWWAGREAGIQQVLSFDGSEPSPEPPDRAGHP